MKAISRFWMVFLLAGSIGLSACSGDDPGTDVRDSGGETGADADAGGEADTTPNDGGDVEDEPDTCVPSVTECSADMCGEVDNGCGEILPCGECPCEAGVVQEESCGTCGLGVRTCGADETGPGSCTAPDILGLAEDADEATCETKLLFADAGASSGGDGTKLAPFASYGDAMAEASAGQVVILGGQTVFEEQLLVKKSVSVIGGFSASPNFEFDSQRRSRFEVAAPDDDAVLGLKADAIDADTVLANIEVTTANANHGQANYGAHVKDSSKLIMRNVRVSAGNAGGGEAGAAGGDGEDGASATDVDPPSNPVDAGGTPGAINPACPEANGGDGGKGGEKTEIGDGENLIPSQDGVDAASGAQGGAAGYGSHSDSGKNGDAGANGASEPQAGSNGVEGQSGGDVEDGLWVPEGRGEDGADGPIGGGGGGGGGAWHGPESSTQGSSVTYYYDGPGGAGGGAGGCGGEGGVGGEPGNGSFGLFLVRSNVTLVDSEFYAGVGGVGGNGGAGGDGGRGGSGGSGSNLGLDPHANPDLEMYLNWSSGDGGDGGDGREGGAGGGGAGGVSYGVYCSQSRTTNEGDTRFVSGASARGGESVGNPGEDGAAEDSFGCD